MSASRETGVLYRAFAHLAFTRGKSWNIALGSCRLFVLFLFFLWDECHRIVTFELSKIPFFQTMSKELYFDIHGEDSGGSLYRVSEPDGDIAFLYNHSASDPATGEVEVFDTWYISFEAFGKRLTKDAEWYYRHPLFVHPEQRDFVRQRLKEANWEIYPDKKWQESHQRQWKKVLTDPTTYYRP